jgi:uncharacterized membrane protein
MQTYGYDKLMFAGQLVKCNLIASFIVMREGAWPLAPLVGTQFLASCITKQHNNFACRMCEHGAPRMIHVRASMKMKEPCCYI